MSVRDSHAESRADARSRAARRSRGEAPATLVRIVRQRHVRERCHRKERIMTLKMNHLHLKTQDPDKTAKFYVDTLGATIVNKNANGGYRLDLHGLALNVSKFLDE